MRRGTGQREAPGFRRGRTARSAAAPVDRDTTARTGTATASADLTGTWPRRRPGGPGGNRTSPRAGGRPRTGVRGDTPRRAATLFAVAHSVLSFLTVPTPEEPPSATARITAWCAMAFTVVVLERRNRAPRTAETACWGEGRFEDRR